MAVYNSSVRLGLFIIFLGASVAALNIGGREVKVLEQKTNWNRALQLCNEHNMEMLTINNQQEEDQLTAIIMEYNVGKVWLGANKLAQNSFSWVTNGRTLNYTGWGEGEPNNVGNEDCVMRGPGSNTWNDVTCGNTGNAVVCSHRELQAQCDAEKIQLESKFEKQQQDHQDLRLEQLLSLKETQLNITTLTNDFKKEKSGHDSCVEERKQLTGDHNDLLQKFKETQSEMTRLGAELEQQGKQHDGCVIDRRRLNEQNLDGQLERFRLSKEVEKQEVVLEHYKRNNILLIVFLVIAMAGNVLLVTAQIVQLRRPPTSSKDIELSKQ